MNTTITKWVAYFDWQGKLQVVPVELEVRAKTYKGRTHISALGYGTMFQKDDRRLFDTAEEAKDALRKRVADEYFEVSARLEQFD